MLFSGSRLPALPLPPIKPRLWSVAQVLANDFPEGLLDLLRPNSYSRKWGEKRNRFGIPMGA